VLNIEGKPAVQSTIEPRRINGRSAKFRITTRNMGTVPLSMIYQGYTTRDANPLRLDFSPGEATIPAGGEGVVNLSIRTKRSSFIGSVDLFKIVVEPEPHDYPELQERLNIEFEHRPLFKSFGGLVKLLLLTALVAAIALAIVLAGGPETVLDYFVGEFPDDVRQFVRDLLGKED
jgi:hypothetical protein